MALHTVDEDVLQPLLVLCVVSLHFLAFGVEAVVVVVVLGSQDVHVLLVDVVADYLHLSKFLHLVGKTWETHWPYQQRLHNENNY